VNKQSSLTTFISTLGGPGLGSGFGVGAVGGPGTSSRGSSEVCRSRFCGSTVLVLPQVPSMSAGPPPATSPEDSPKLELDGDVVLILDDVVLMPSSLSPSLFPRSTCGVVATSVEAAEKAVVIVVVGAGLEMGGVVMVLAVVKAVVAIAAAVVVIETAATVGIAGEVETTVPAVAVFAIADVGGLAVVAAAAVGASFAVVIGGAIMVVEVSVVALASSWPLSRLSPVESSA